MKKYRFIIIIYKKNYEKTVASSFDDDKLEFWQQEHQSGMHRVYGHGSGIMPASQHAGINL